jgi:phosphoribosylaminoimidazole carboxylase PurE protein
MDDFLSNNVNAFKGAILLCDSYVTRLFPAFVEQLSADRSCFTYAPESHHIDQLGFKLCTALRIGNISEVAVLTKDGSPHSLQIPLVAQEAAVNASFSLDKLSCYVVEKETLIQVSQIALRVARHLSEIDKLINGAPLAALDEAPPTTKPFVAVLVGGRSDLARLEKAEMTSIFYKVGLHFELTVISSEQNPEELRSYCKDLSKRGVTVLICVAGSVPGLPAAAKAHLPAVPVISVPLTVPDFEAREILLASLSVPARRPVILTGLDELGLRKAAYVACEIVAASVPKLRDSYLALTKLLTPKPDFHGTPLLIPRSPGKKRKAKFEAPAEIQKGRRSSK